MQSHEIEKKMKELEAQLRDELKTEWVKFAKMLIKRHPKEEATGYLKEELLNAARSNRSSWSGGHSVTNLAEQAKQDVALDLLGNIPMHLGHVLR